MAGVRVLADGKTKFTILTTAPANPAAPTATELNAGIDLSCKVVASDFNWTATDSEKVNEPALCDDANSNSLGTSNYSAAFSLWRYFLVGGGADPTDDAGFEAVKTKGTTLWGYARMTDKEATAAWASTDEIYLGAEFTTDTPQQPQGGGWQKFRVPCEVQRGWDFIEVAAGA